MQQFTYNGGANQIWDLGTLIQQYPWNGGDNQQWSITEVGNTGSYVIQNKASGKVLDIPGFSSSDGTVIQQYTYNGGKNQLWIIGRE